jgi:hypothetical protein
MALNSSNSNETKRVVDFDELYPGRFIKAGSLQGKKITLTISAVHVEKLEGDAGAKWKGVVTFEKTEMQLVLNRTNGTCLREMFGREVPKWIGRKVTLFPSEWNGEPCIRVWGSPELKADKAISIQLPRRKPVTMVMHAMKAPGQNGNAKTAPTAPEPSRDAAPVHAHDADTGEVHDDADDRELSSDGDEPF